MSIIDLLAFEHPDETEHPENAKSLEAAILKGRNIDRDYAACLYPAINLHPRRSELRRKLGNLALLIDPDMRDFSEDPPEFHESCASCAYLVDKSYRVGAAAESLVGENRENFVITSISSNSWRYEIDELDKLSKPDFVDKFANNLENLGLDANHGSLLAFVHIAFDALHREVELSFFGLADRPMAEAIGQLRRFPLFTDPSQARDLIRIKPLVDYKLPLTTLVQTDWTLKVDYVNDGIGHSIEFEGPLPNPYHAQSMLWRDRWDLSQATIMIGLYVRGDELVTQSRHDVTDEALWSWQ